MSIFETIIIAIVEGLTEFLPVSSTDYCPKLVGSRKHGVCEGIHLHHPIWCHTFGSGPLLEAILPTEPYTCSRGRQWFTTLFAQI